MKGSKKLAITILFFIGIATDYSQPVSRQEKESITYQHWRTCVMKRGRTLFGQANKNRSVCRRPPPWSRWKDDFLFRRFLLPFWRFFKMDRQTSLVRKDGNKLHKNKSASYQIVFLDVRIGRDFNISKKFWIEIDAGTMFQLYHKKDVLNNTADWMDIKSPILPAFGITLLYKIWCASSDKFDLVLPFSLVPLL